MVDWLEIKSRASIIFPDPRLALEDGLVAVGGTLDTPTLVAAYSRGIFPWPQEGLPVLWFSPETRGILEFKDLHISRSLEKKLRKHEFKITHNQAFQDVIKECALQPRKDQKGTWITTAMQLAYTQLHFDGLAHSFEVWRDAELVGGIYGVYVEGVFSGESMFHKCSDASKVALVQMVQTLSSWGLSWMDTQMVTPILETMGAHSISRDEFLLKLKRQQRQYLTHNLTHSSRQ